MQCTYVLKIKKDDFVFIVLITSKSQPRESPHQSVPNIISLKKISQRPKPQNWYEYDTNEYLYAREYLNIEDVCHILHRPKLFLWPFKAEWVVLWSSVGHWTLIPKDLGKHVKFNAMKEVLNQLNDFKRLRQVLAEEYIIYSFHIWMHN